MKLHCLGTAHVYEPGETHCQCGKVVPEPFRDEPMTSHECGKKLGDVNDYKDYLIQCRACFDKCQVLINEDPNKKVEWVGYKKFNSGEESSDSK